MKKQSILAILIAALLVLTVFTGCAANSKMAPAAPASMDSSYYDSTQEAAAAETPMEAPAEPEEEFAYDTVATTEAGSGAAETPEPDDSVADYTAKIIYTASPSRRPNLTRRSPRWNRRCRRSAASWKAPM